MSCNLSYTGIKTNRNRLWQLWNWRAISDKHCTIHWFSMIISEIAPCPVFVRAYWPASSFHLFQRFFSRAKRHFAALQAAATTFARGCEWEELGIWIEWAWISMIHNSYGYKYNWIYDYSFVPLGTFFSKHAGSNELFWTRTYCKFNVFSWKNEFNLCQRPS